MSNYFCGKWSRISQTGTAPDKNIIKKELFRVILESGKLKCTETRQFICHCVCDIASGNSTVKLIQFKFQGPSFVRVPSKLLGRDKVICSHDHIFFKKFAKSEIF